MNFSASATRGGWLGKDDPVFRQHLRRSAAGVALIVTLGVFLLWLAWRSPSAAESSEALHLLRISQKAMVDLRAMAAMHDDVLENNTPRHLEQFNRRRDELCGTLKELTTEAKAASAGSATPDLSASFEKWLEKFAAPQALAIRGNEPASAVTRAAAAAAVDEMTRTAAVIARHAQASLEQAHARAEQTRWLFLGAILLLSGTAVTILSVTQLGSHRSFREHLHKSESALAQTRSIIATTQDCVLVMDENGVIESINPAGEKIFAQPAAKVVGQNISLLIPQRLFFHDLARLNRGSMMAVGQRQGYFSFPIEISLSELKLEGRRHFCALIRDVSDRRNGEEILKTIALGVSTTTGEEFVRSLLRQLSKALENEQVFLVEILGKGPSAVATLTTAKKGEVRATAPINLKNTAAEEVLTRGLRVYQTRVHEQFPEDEMLKEVAAHAFVGMPLVDHAGRSIGVMGVIDQQEREDTQVIESTLQIFAGRAAAEIERKRYEEALAAEKERLAVTLRSIGDGCLTLDNDGRILTLNPVAERLTGWTQEAAAGRPLGEVLHLLDERNRRRSQHTLQRIAANGVTEETNTPMILVPSQGEERIVESSSAPIRDSAGRKVGVVIVLRDVTERRRLQEEYQKAEKLESLGLVAGGIAHDFNNIFTAILGNVTLAMSAEGKEAAAERLVAARAATKRAQELAGQLLTFASGGTPVKQTTDLAQLISDTVECALAGSRTVADIHCAPDLHPIEADPGQLAQVIANLTTNAEQAMPNGGALLVTAENVELTGEDATSAKTRWVRLLVQDQGVGIQEQYLKKIFDPYFTTKPKGSGLGLAAAYSIVKNHGGNIAVESTPSRGSTFTVTLPASSNSLTPATPPPEPPEVPHGAGRVLVLDDEEVICMLVTCALEPLGYEVTETQDGAVALKKYEEAMRDGRKFDLVISDLTMPGRMSGQETIQRLRELDPGVRAIVSSGYANDPVMSNHQLFGFSGVIAKPYEIDALGRKVAEVMAQNVERQVIYHAFEERKTA